MAITKIDTGMRKVSPTDYAAADKETRTKLFNALTKQIFDNRIIDLLNQSNDALSDYLVKPVEFGSGWRNITLGLADIETYTDNPEARYSKTRNLLKDYVEQFERTTRELIRITFNRLQVQEYFKDTEQLEKFIQLAVKRVSDTFALRNYEFLKVVFGATDATTYALSPTSEMYKVAKEWNEQIKNVITYTGNGVEPLVQTIKQTLTAMTIEATDRFHSDNTITGLPVSVSLDDLILIMSAEDKQEWDKFVSENQRNPEFYKLPELKTKLMNIPKGTAYIQQKGQMEIAPHFDEQYTEFFPLTLDMDLIHHSQFKFGFSKLHNLVKITKAGTR